ncbi:MAG: hypothetical protein ACRDH9_07145 [Actinomycetota bacterium]
MKRLAALFVILAVGACSRTPSPESGELLVTPMGGEVQLIDGDETSILDEATTVDNGVGVLTGANGRAAIELPGGPSIELAPGAEVRLEGDTSQVARGSVLVRAPESDIRLTAGSADIEATNSVFRVNRDLSVVLAVYSGSASLLGAGVEVPSLREATVLANGQLSEGFKPIEVHPNDVWDNELLGPAIDLGFRLLNLERGLTRQLPRGEDARAVSAALVQEKFSRSSIESAIRVLGSAARVVVAAAVAQEISRVDGSPLSGVFQEVINLQAAAAHWGVIIAQWSLEDASAALLEALGGLTLAIARSVPPPPAPSSTASTGPGQSVTGDRNPGGGSETNGSPPGDRNTQGNAPPPAPPEEDQQVDTAPSCANQVDCAVEDVLDGPPPTGPGLSP